jgi:hypothetical protein
MGQIVAGLKPGRESEDETILFWHRGLSLSDIALGHFMLEKASGMGSASACATREPQADARQCADVCGQCRSSRRLVETVRTGL